jgi:predicted ATPase
MARLDRLATVKSLAQLGATLGHGFSYELLQAVSPWDEGTVRQGLHQLVEAEFLYQTGLPPQATYRFKHTLIQDAAYQSLLKSTRQHYHQRIAQVLGERFPETVAAQPELLAYHYTEAGLAAQAMPYWQRAGQRAGERSAHAEAIAHLTKGLDVLQRLPDTPSRAQHELDFQTTLGRALAIVRGHAAPETAHAYARARELCRHGGDPARLFDIQVGLREFYLNRGELHTARELAEVCLALAQGQLDPASRMRALFGLGSVLHSLGEFAQGRDHLEQAIALYTPHQDRSLTGQAPLGVPCLARLASTLWHLGYPRLALARNREMLTLAHELSDAYNLMRARCYAAEFYHLLREVAPAQEQAEAALSLSTEQAFSPWVGAGMFWRGWGLAAQGWGEEGIAAMRQGLGRWQATGSVYTRPTWLALLAEAHRESGQVEEGLRLLAEALALIKETGMRAYEAEMYRLQGELLLHQEVPDEGQAEAGFHHALDVARQQQAKSLELRAAISLSRLWQRQGKPDAARHLLAESYGWFTEGFDTADLQEAKALLDALRG